ncbi:MAG: hypothetical protein JRN08_03600 [Nitrososphaerota archaeon]|nr:hypothetical protein [Nitrososphaerota archaeon]
MRYGVIAVLVSAQLVLLLLGHSSLVPLGLASPAVLLLTGTDFESLAGSLSKKGVKATAPAQIVGKSGVKHEFAFAVRPDEARAKVVVDTELSVKDVEEMKVLKFYVKVFDVGPENAILCVSPRLSGRAADLAREYGIKVVQDDVPKKLAGLASKAIGEILGKGAR